ncbi:hypothetical protein FACS1894192_00070 [Bacilli bacterium]|nr:hypothetical protein FACS1894192_00070 [Bacilli bacterium]
MVEKKGFFQRKATSKTSESGTPLMTQQIEEIGRQVLTLRQKLKVAEQEKENIKLEFDALKQGKLKESQAELAQKTAQFDTMLVAQRDKSKQQLSALEGELATKTEQLSTVEVALEVEKEKVTSLSQTLETSSSTKDAEIKQLTKEKLEIKSQVSEVLLELQEHFDYKTALLETERELLAQEKVKADADRLQKLEACEVFTQQAQDEAAEMIETAKATVSQMMQQAQAEIAEKEAQSKEELNRLKTRIDYYSSQINDAAQTIEVLLSSVSHL